MTGRAVPVQFEPLHAWPFPDTADRVCSPFRADYDTTLGLLDRELRLLDAPAAAIRLVIGAHHVRQDRQLRANARVDHPGVVVAFESRFGPLEMFCDRFDSRRRDAWHDNLRAIALGLEALRRVDRYGVGGTGQQYAGWRQIEGPRPPSAAAPTKAQARARLAEIAQCNPNAPDRSLIRLGRAFAHPDRHGGYQELFDEANRMAEVLE